MVVRLVNVRDLQFLELVFGPGEQYLEKSSLVGTKSGIFLQCALVRGSCSVVVN